MKLSVIITAYNDEETIEECLESFINQSLSEEKYELVVVNDGATDKTEEIVRGYVLSVSNLRLVSQTNLGVAAARNHGAAEAHGEILLFTQADIVAADEKLLTRHLNFHQNPQHLTSNIQPLTLSLVGHTNWHPDFKITPFMEWLESGGPQFKFQQPGKVGFLNFYTTNVSLKKEFFKKAGGFDEDFKLKAGITAYEDTELGYRLEMQGLQLFYDPTALVYHHHHKTLNDVLQRRYHEGIMSHKLTTKHPNFKWDRDTSDLQVFLLSFWLLNPLLMYPFKLLAGYLQDKTVTPYLYKAVTRAWYNYGYLRGSL